MQDKKSILQLLEGVLIFIASIGFFIMCHDFLGKPIAIPDVQVIVILVFISIFSMPVCAIVMFFAKRKWKKIIGIMFLFGTIGTLILFGRAFV